MNYIKSFFLLNGVALMYVFFADVRIKENFRTAQIKIKKSKIHFKWQEK